MTISSLAYTDPVDLSIRTNLEFGYVVDCVSQALAWIYFQSDLTKLTKYSLRGAQETIAVLAWAHDSSDPTRQANAKRTIFDAAQVLGLSPEAMETTLRQIAEDPYARFLAKVWT